ncbi:D-glycerate dehydrogenase [Actinocatenispora comari]|uniref:D-glycerate dehydrogenase n=1 Tax=Actinocatenispora comari TaxID=2807577 RepID=A0A8J4AHJ6_9ACTN|nr:D-glycerate dehydrogenase [Actinocatenispora comari]
MPESDGVTAFWVHGVASVGERAVARLRRERPDWRFTDGAPPADARYSVLVAGRPDEALLSASPALRTLVVPFAGIPAQTAERLADRPGIAVRTLHHTAGPTAELALGLVLAAARALVPADRAMRDGDWTPRFVPPEPTMVLAGHTATVVGYGQVGRRVARALAALDLRVNAIRAGARGTSGDGVALIHPPRRLPDLLRRSRVVVLAVPLSARTTGLIGAPELALLPDPAVLVNVARAAVVDEAALYQRLLTGRLAAGLDVWWSEASGDGPRTGVAASRFPFHQLPNVVLSPHRGGAFSLPEVQRARLTELTRVLDDLSVHSGE